MKRIALALPLAVALFGLGACKNQTNDTDAIRAGILQHLISIGTLNMNAMDMYMLSVSVTGNQAHAEVEFRAKGTGGPGGGMQVAYDLEKRGGAWVVLKTQPLGGAMQHPATNLGPNANQSSSTKPPVHSGTMPNFDELLNAPTAPGRATLPPGHPPVIPRQTSTTPSSQEQGPAKKP